MNTENTKGQLAADRAKRAAERKKQAENQAERETKIAEGLKRSNGKRHTYAPLAPAGRYDFALNIATHRFSTEIQSALHKSEKLLKSGSLFETPIKQLDTFCKEIYGLGYLDKASSWKPSGKGAKTHLHSLIEHMLVTYKVPEFMYAAFRETETLLAQKQIKLFYRLTSGESLNKLVGTEDFPPPFTRKMCHELNTLGLSNFSVPQAVRHVQGTTFNGDKRLVNALLRANALSRTVHNPPNIEALWQSVIQWFCVHAQFFNPNMVNPVVDYLAVRIRDQTFSMKGRTPNSIMRDMNEWHKQLGQGDIYAHEYSPSGLKSGQWQSHFPGSEMIEYTWTLNEILSGKGLADEGRSLHHCVASYGNMVANGSVSIWSMKRNGERHATIEVHNAHRQINQARGSCNRSLNNDEKKYLKLWAQDNNLEFGSYL
jgi:hypothetical protein